MTRHARLPFRGAATLLVVALAVAVPAAHADPRPGPPPEATEHTTLEGALGAVGMDRATFETQAETADRLSAAAEEYAARYPEAFAGVRVVGARGQVGVIPGADDEDALTSDARSRGFSTFAAPVPARSLDQTAERVQSWTDSLPPEQREEVAVTEVDPATGDVTVVVTDSDRAPAPPADLGADVRRGTFHKAQSLGSGGGAATPIDPAPTDPTPPGGPTPPTVPDGALLGGDRYLATDPATGAGAWCSFGFNGIRDGRVVNITATHCGEFAGASPTTSRWGTVSLAHGGTELGRFTAAEADHKMDAALVTIADDARPRFTNNLVRSSGGAPLAITGTASPVVGQTVCKYGRTSAYTCGTVSALDSTRAPGQVTVDICVLAGDSGGVFFAGSRALAITSMSNAFDMSTGQPIPYTSCREAEAGVRAPLQAIVVAVPAIVERFPGLSVRTS